MKRGIDVIGKEIRDGKYLVVGKSSTQGKLLLKCKACGKLYEVFSSSVYKGDANPCRCNRVGEHIIGLKFRGGNYTVVGTVKGKRKVKVRCNKCLRVYESYRCNVIDGSSNPCRSCYPLSNNKKGKSKYIGKVLCKGRYEVMDVVGAYMFEVKCVNCGEKYKCERTSVISGTANPCRKCYPLKQYNKGKTKYAGKNTKDGRYRIIGIDKNKKSCLTVSCNKCNSVYSLNRKYLGKDGINICKKCYPRKRKEGNGE